MKNIFVVFLLFIVACKGVQTGDSQTNIDSNNPQTIDPYNIEQCRKCTDPEFREQVSSEEECSNVCVEIPEATPVEQDVIIDDEVFVKAQSCSEQCELVILSVDECKELFDNVC